METQSNLKEKELIFIKYQNEVIFNNMCKYREENVKLKAIIVKMSSRIAELEEKQKYI